MNPSSVPTEPKKKPAVEQGITFDALNTGVIAPSGTLDADMDSTRAVIDAEEHKAHSQLLASQAAKSKRRVVKFAGIGLALVIGLSLVALRHNAANKTMSSGNADASQRFSNTTIPLTPLDGSSASIQNAQTLSVNGQLNVNNSLVISPAAKPSNAVAGQLYFDQTSNELSYYNGTSFVPLTESVAAPNGVLSVGGAKGNVGLGNGLSVNGNTLSNTGVLGVGGTSGNIGLGGGLSVAGGTLTNTGVLTLQGQAGNITLTGGPGLVVSGTTLSNSGLLSLAGQTGDITLGSGLGMSGNQLRNTGIISAVGAGTVTVTNDGNGNITIDAPTGGGGGSGTVASPGGSINKIAKFTGVQTIADSLISDNGTLVTVGGDLSVTGNVSFTNALPVTSGGTGSNNAATARSNLSAAKSGANSDITSLSGLTTALSVAQGGIGVGTLATNGVLLGNGTSALTSVVAGSSGLCLVSAAGAPTWSSCPGAGGVSSLDGGTGALILNNSSLVGSNISIDNATTAAKGIASFNVTNFSVASGAVNTIQNINTTAAPTFGQLTLTSSQASNPMFVVNNTNVAASGSLLDLQLNGGSKFSVSPAGNVVSSGTLNGQTISAAASFTGTVAVATTLSVNTITPTSSLTIGSTGQSFLLQGNASSALTATNGASTTTLGFQTPTANVTYNFPTATAGTYNVCTTAGNCVGVGGSVSTPGGTTNKVAKFTAGSTIGDSIITDNGSTVTIGGTLSVNTLTPTAALTVGATGQNLTLQGATVSLSATSTGITNSLTFATPSSSNKTITIPNASGTVAVSASGPLSMDANGNLTCPTCLTSGGGGGSAGVSSVNGLTGALTLQGASAGSVSNAGTTITINDATSAVKGLASFNATNFSVTSGAVNTVQDIAVTSTPTFGGLTLTSALTVANGGTGATTAANARTNLSAAKSGANSDITSLSGLTTALSVAQGGTGIATTPTNGQILIGNGTNYSLNTLSAGSGITITNGAGTITIAAPNAGTCSTCAATSLNNLAGVAINTSLLPGTAGGADLGSGTLPFGQLFLAGTSASPATNNFKITGASTSGTRTITLPDASGTVAVSASGNIALSAAGNITFTGTLAVGNGGTGLTSYTANQLLYATSSSALGQFSNGSSGNCLVSNGAGSAPSFQACPGAGGVSSVDALSGALTINNTSGVGTTITIDDAKADGATKGIAAFNSTNFTATSGVINTIQNIATTSTPTFTGVNTNTITPSSALTVGATGQSFTLQGSSASTITATGGGFTTTLGFTGTPTGAVTYNFDRAASTGTYTVCTTAGNCLGGGSGGANTSLSNLTSTSVNQSLIANANNSLDLGSSGTTWRNGYFGTEVYTPIIDVSSASTLSVGTSNATQVNLAKSGVLTNVLGTLTSAGLITGNAGLSVTGATSLSSGAAGTVALKIQGASSQTADLLQIADSTTANLLRVDASGNEEHIGFIDTPNGGFGSYGNLLTFSEQLDNAAWTATDITVTANDGASNPAPDGNTTAEKLVSGTGANHTLQQTYTTSTNGNYTFSMWVKTNSGTQSVSLRIDSTGATPTTGTASNFTATTTWQRFSVTQNFTGTPSNVKPTFIIGSNSATVVGWGAQLVAGTSAQVYTRTTSSSVAATNGSVVNGTGLLNNGTLTSNGLITGNNGLTITGATNLTGSLTQSGGAISLTGNAASSIAATTGGITLQTTTNSGQTIGIGNNALAQTISIGNSTGATAVNISSGSGNISMAGNTSITGSNTFTSGTGAVSLQGATTVSANLTVTNAGSLNLQRATDYSTTGSQNDVNLGSASLVRLTGASAQTITGISGGVDGRVLVIVNAGSNAATLSNSSASSAAANRILTGTAADLTLNADASVTLVYDAGASRWRVSGAVAGGAAGGSYILNQTSQQTSANFNISGTGQAANFDATSGALGIGNSVATSITVGNTANTSAYTLQGTTAATYTLGTTTGTGTITLGRSTASNTINIGNGATTNTQTINIGTGATGVGKETITIGSTNDGSALTLQAGTGNLTMLTNSATANIIAKSSTNGTGAFQIQNSSGTALFNADTTNGTVTIAGTATNAPELIIKQYSGQTDVYPMIKLADSTGTELARITTDTSGNLFMGYVSGSGWTSGSGLNTGYGSNSLASLTTGTANTAVGTTALSALATGSNNVAVGTSAGSTITGDNNVAIGKNVFGGNLAISNNVGIGLGAGSIGSSADSNFYLNTLIGNNAGAQDAAGFITSSTLQWSSAIGADAIVQANHSVVLGNVDINNPIKVGIGITIPTNALSVSPVDYDTGTISQSASATVVGSGTTFTSAMVGETLIYADGTSDTITGFTNATHITVGTSRTHASSNYRIHHVGFQVKQDGTAYLQQTSTTAFQVQNTAGTAIFTTDTTNARVYVGPTAGDTVGTLLVLGNKTNAGDPTEVDGGIYYNSSSHSFRCGVDGTWVSCIGGLLYSNTSVSTAIANTTTETNFDRNVSIPANYCTQGRVIRVTAYGYYSDTGTPNLTFKLKMGTTAVLTGQAWTGGSGVTDQQWMLTGQLTCDAAPSAASAIEAQGWFQGFQTGNNSGVKHALGGTSTTNVATNAAQTLQVSLTWGTASASNTATLRSITVEGLGP